MKHTRAARAYAKAALQTAQRSGETESLRESMERIQQTLDASHDLRAFLANPLIASSAKRAAVQQIFGETTTDAAMSFLELLIERKRERELEAIAAETLRQLDEAEGVVRAQAVAAAALTDEQTAALANALSQATGRDIRLSVSEDPALIAGFIVRVGDTVYDGSLATQLERLRGALSQDS